MADGSSYHCLELWILQNKKNGNKLLWILSSTAIFSFFAPSVILVPILNCCQLDYYTVLYHFNGAHTNSNFNSKMINTKCHWDTFIITFMLIFTFVKTRWWRGGTKWQYDSEAEVSHFPQLCARNKTGGQKQGREIIIINLWNNYQGKWSHHYVSIVNWTITGCIYSLSEIMINIGWMNYDFQLLIIAKNDFPLNLQYAHYIWDRIILFQYMLSVLQSSEIMVIIVRELGVLWDQSKLSGVCSSVKINVL